MDPYGRVQWPFVYEANMMLARYALIALAGICRQVYWMLENPDRSTVHLQPAMQFLLRPPLKPLLIKWRCPQFEFSSCFGVHVSRCCLGTAMFM